MRDHMSDSNKITTIDKRKETTSTDFFHHLKDI